jgi:urease accessory protein
MAAPAPVLPAALLLLADSRLPAGGHAHSGSLAAAVTAGSVDGERTLSAFLSGRLHTTGLVAAAAAARTAALVVDGPAAAGALADLDAELDARTPSPAARAASRAQGRGLLRAASAAWPSPVHALLGGRPHAACAQGAAAVAAGAGPAEAAVLAALSSITGPASAAVRLLGLDPIGVTGLLARLAPDVDAVAAEGARWADLARPLPGCSAPLLDLLAQAHARAEVRLFAS